MRGDPPVETLEKNHQQLIRRVVFWFSLRGRNALVGVVVLL